MKIGLPRGLMYYWYGKLYSEFFTALGFDVLVSPESDAEILASGLSLSVDECCLPAKLFLGHIKWLLDKTDYVLVPRLESCGKSLQYCTKFNALFDIARNTFREQNELKTRAFNGKNGDFRPNSTGFACAGSSALERRARLIGYSLDKVHGASELRAFMGLGRELGFGRRRVARAYLKARAAKIAADKLETNREQARLGAGGLRVLVVGHPYNSRDLLIGMPVVRLLEKEGANVVFADKLADFASIEAAASISKTLYWGMSKELVGTAWNYRNKIDGLVLLSAVPCGPDALVNELLIRKLKTVPICNIIVDESCSQTGLQTRIESFVDILKFKAQIIT